MFGRHTEYAIADNFTKYTVPFHLKNNGLDTASTENPPRTCQNPVGRRIFTIFKFKPFIETYQNKKGFTS